jgi:predicted nicotinamide N-methyase
MEYENAQLEVGVPLVVWGASLTLSRWLEDYWEQLGI